MSRTDARSTSLRRRSARTVPATIVGLVLLALGIGLVWTSVLALVDGAWPALLGRFHRWIAALTWGSTLAVVISAAGCLVGVILVIAALKPGPPNALRLDGPGSSTAIASTEFVMTRRSVARLAAAHADTVDGVDTVSAVAGAKRVTMAVRTPSAQSDDIARQVDTTVRRALEASGLTPVPSVRTDVRSRRP